MSSNTTSPLKRKHEDDLKEGEIRGPPPPQKWVAVKTQNSPPQPPPPPPQNELEILQLKLDKEKLQAHVNFTCYHEKKAKLETAEATIKQNNETITRLRTERNELWSSYDNAKKRLLAADEQLKSMDALKEEKDDWRMKYELAKRRLDTANQQHALVNREKQSWKDKYTNLLTSNKTLKDSLDAKTHELKTAEERLEKLQMESLNHAMEVKKKDRHLASKESLLSSLESKLETIEKDQAALKGKYTRLLGHCKTIQEQKNAAVEKLVAEKQKRKNVLERMDKIVTSERAELEGQVLVD